MLKAILLNATTLISLSIFPLFSSELNKQIFSFDVDYKDLCTELCLIGASYDTDKSSQRKNDSRLVYCHPYTIFYDSIFKHLKNEQLTLAEIGIFKGASLLMWRDYFPQAEIHGYEYSKSFINHFKENFSSERINLYEIDVTRDASIRSSFKAAGLLYDIIIDDSTHQMDDQIRIIQNVYPFLKPGGIFIVEDIFKKYKEQDYIDKLESVLENFSSCFFISMDHVNKYSPGWDNDKLLVLVKSGEDPLLRHKEITINIPSINIEGLKEIKFHQYHDHE